MSLASLPSGTVDFQVYGPETTDRPPVLFVHGVLVDMQLWDRVAGSLGAAGHRCWSATWPLGSHRIACPDAVTDGPRGVARMVADFIEDRGIEGCTLVGNDTGGAICQYLLHERPELVSRVVLTDCDAFDVFPPQPFSALFALLRRRPLLQPLMATMRAVALRHSPLGFGLLLTEPDPELTASWVRPAQVAAKIRADLVALLRAIDPAELARITPTMRDFPGPVTLVWGTADRSFTPALGRRLAAAFGDDRPGGVRFVEVDGARTFVALDAPQAVVDAIVDIADIG
ncbi:alpha/beta fold hydrolase [Tsukamurella pseudospumae]|uniref:Alpha/beta hydrolase n=1 Tax=Tsukamurella pseudospumae TaxID=239498 RepID=A0A138A441_9ACTN|nr:alpha/beta hydrolase [Tsukamurella pseudospumae]KXO96341.1 alpha/beta hydrolase [Tsukamurella pseudospumae]KXP05192.1 alpha/beta hydrolase [Tsukamurella pseudospumae]